MDDGSGLEHTFLQRKAKFHKRCRSKLNQNELKRVKKRKANTIEADAKERVTLRKGRKVEDSAIRLSVLRNVCDKHETMVQVTTFETDARVPECAANLQDHNHLLVKLSERDLIQGSYVFRNSKIQGYPGLFYSFFHGFSWVLGSPE